MITSAEVRQKYVDFFVQRAHKHVASAPLVPPDDPTLLFTTAGMVQFKANYSGGVPLEFTRAVTVQKCLRAGGKGSDLENVGRTLRHHTFFEMLGNFSFGDYFKKDAIEWAWEFCVGKDWLALPGERIFATVFGKPNEGGWTVDEEAERFWIDNTGIVNPITRLDESENFWGPAGGTGACGPCSEIKFFMGTDAQLREYQALAKSGPEGMAKLAHDIVEEGDMFLEIWNLVFPQYDQQPDGARPPLKNRGIDTGAGLERVTTACQMAASGGMVWSPYETDLLAPIVKAACEVSGLPYPRIRGGEAEEKRLKELGHDPAAVRLAMNACADHVRALAFALSEGIVPSNEGRGYVIRRILRRAARFGRKIGVTQPFLWKMIDPVLATMGSIYPELLRHPEQVKKSIRAEEERFNRTLNMGSDMLEQMLAGRAAGARLAGEEAFRLYDTYGFPLDLVAEICEERGIAVDVEGYESQLKESKKRARASWKGKGGVDLGQFVADLKNAGRATEFVGHSEAKAEAEILALVRGDQRADALEEGQTGIVILSRTPFYGEGGGQVGDQGALLGADGAELFKVEDTQKTDDGYVFHFGHAASRLSSGQAVIAQIDESRRAATMKNHSATHLLQGALKRLVGSHVTQSGSYVGPDHLRFDFSNPEPVAEETLRRIEQLVNHQVQRNLPVTTEVLDLETARQTGAIAPFGEKYGARVRVVKMGDFSTEFCGGTHLKSTGEVGPFIIVSESSVASGIRRIEAKTGAGAAAEISHERSILARLSRALAVGADQIEERVAALQSDVKKLKRELERARTESASGKASEFKTETIGDVTVLAGWIENAGVDQLRAAIDGIRGQRQNQKFLALLGSGEEGKATLIAGASPDLEGSPLEAGKVIKELVPAFGGKGGGKAALAQAGVKDAAKLRAALESGEILDPLKQAAGR